MKSIILEMQLNELSHAFVQTCIKSKKMRPPPTFHDPIGKSPPIYLNLPTAIYFRDFFLLTSYLISETTL